MIMSKEQENQLLKAYNSISPQSQDMVMIMVKQLAEREGISVDAGSSNQLDKPADGISMWVAKMKQEGYSPRTIDTYVGTVKLIFAEDPKPTRLSLQALFAKKLETQSTARVAVNCKALRNLFNFLHEEGLWPTNPTTKLKTARVVYRSKDLPAIEDITKLMEYECHRSSDTPKFRTILFTLVTTGLRISECCSIEKENINFRSQEIKVVGKGNKEGMVAFPPVTGSMIWEFMQDHPSKSKYLFPGLNNGSYSSTSSFEKTIRRACKKLDIKPINPHLFRHFFATFMLKGGAKLEVVSKLLRHASVAITADIYRHVDTKEMHQEAKLFGPLAMGPLMIPENTGDIIEGETKESDEEG